MCGSNVMTELGSSVFRSSYSDLSVTGLEDFQEVLEVVWKTSWKSFGRLPGRRRKTSWKSSGRLPGSRLAHYSLDD
ncbi:hypothetical protein DY000_02016956 [Brassica cretica]|uniref:Uncharacterized protein n=1 Tax=Brassica cretica TaxID=69181 RepID=A0ABQ7D8K4_BRACR|nr:hypothetical protein DY000_02016956 [Brassica cretica]